MRRIVPCLCCAAAVLLVSGCADLKNSLPNPVTPGPVVHAEGWNDPGNTAAFHGTYLKQRAWNLSTCKSCHGGTFAGGSSTVSCFPCHDAYPHEVKFSKSGNGSHVLYLRTKSYPLNDCKACHGDDYFGGTAAQTQVSCGQAQCHATLSGTPKSPEACNTCHGQFHGSANDTASWAPPVSLNNDTLSSARGVGAHQLHLGGTGLTSTTSVQCTGCHSVPASLYARGHFDTPGPARVSLTIPLASTPSGGLTPSPAYDAQTLKCANTYCHGSWQLLKSNPLTFNNFYSDSIMTGSFAAPKWNGGSGEAPCGSCHGLPPKGHIDASLDQCAGCHIGVVNTSGQIIDKSKHINGKANVFNQELSFK